MLIEKVTENRMANSFIDEPITLKDTKKSSTTTFQTQQME